MSEIAECLHGTFQTVLVGHRKIDKCVLCGAELKSTPILRDTEMVDHPPHYNAHPSGVECITVTEHFNFNRCNALKYIWRAGEKGGPAQEIQDLEKARWYLEREISRLKKAP